MDPVEVLECREPEEGCPIGSQNSFQAQLPYFEKSEVSMNTSRDSSRSTLPKLIVVSLFVFVGTRPADAGLLYSASLKNGDYGGGFQVGAFQSGAPWNRSGSTGGNLSALGIVDSSSGVTFTTPHDVINFSLGADGKNRTSFRISGTVSVRFKANSTTFDGGQPFVDNYGFNQFNSGQATFGTAMNRHAGADSTPNTADDRVSFGWSTLHGGVWYSHTNSVIAADLPDFDNWHHVGFAWGGSNNDFEVWIDGFLLASNNIPASFPWGGSQAAYNFALGEIHERAVSDNSPEGVMFADLEIWDEYRELGNTTTIVPEPSSLVIFEIGVIGLACFTFQRRRRSDRSAKQAA